MNQTQDLLLVGQLQASAMEDFSACCDNPFQGLKKVPRIEKLYHEREIRKLMERCFKKLELWKDKDPQELSVEEQAQVEFIFREILLELDRKKLFFDRPFLTLFLEKGYLDTTKGFFRAARAHDPQFQFMDLFQAMRNVWIMNSLQLLFDLPVQLTPSVFSYSMLYPYTDNYLDDPTISSAAKRRFNQRLEQVLQGNPVEEVTPEEDKIFQMVHNIEEEFSRIRYPEVYDSLLLIQDAQSASMAQDNQSKLSPQLSLPISFYKGGSSVLADAFLVKGELTETEMDFTFGYGCFLQLLDDLQDVESDRKDGHWTLFSHKNEEAIFDQEVLKLLCFIQKVMTKHHLGYAEEALMKDVIAQCTRMMVMEVIGRNPQLVSENLYDHLESYSKVRLSFYKEFREKVESYFQPSGLLKPVTVPQLIL